MSTWKSHPQTGDTVSLYFLNSKLLLLKGKSKLKMSMGESILIISLVGIEIPPLSIPLMCVEIPRLPNLTRSISSTGIYYL